MPETLTEKKQKLPTREEVASLIENENFEEAETQIRALLEESPDDMDLLNTLGSVLAQRGDYYNAEITFKKIVSENPEYGDAYFNLGLAQSKQSRITEAIGNYLKAIEINEGDFAAHNDLGVLYHSQGKAHLAKGHFIKALEANPMYKRALMNLFEVCWDADSYSEGLAWIEKFLSVASNNQGGHNFEYSTPADTVVEPNEKENDIIDTAGPVKKQGAIKLTKRSLSDADEIFLKHVPQELWERKTGKNIAIVADFNIAGQLSLLFRMINRYTIHKARLIIIQGDYLSYDKDLILSKGNEDTAKEALRVIENADFYHMGRFPKDIEGVKWENYVRPNNSLIQYYGSEIRMNGEQIYKWHTQNKILGLSCWDYTMLQDAPFFYHTNIMCDFSRIKPCAPPDDDVIRICHPPTNREFKKTDLFLSVVDKLKKKGHRFEVELIEGKSNEECLDIKSRCHITYDQISVGIYGLSAIESMAAGHAVICGISNFASSYHPDNPIVYATEENLQERLEYLLQNKDQVTRIGNAGRIWAKTHHDPMKLIKQYVWIYDMVMNGHRLVENRDMFLLK